MSHQNQPSIPPTPPAGTAHRYASTLPSALPNVPPGQGGMRGMRKKNGLGVTALVLGAVAFFFAWIPIVSYFSIVLGGIGLLLGILALVLRNSRTGLAIAGTAVSAVAVFAAILMTVFYAAVFSAATTSVSGQAASGGDPAASAPASHSASSPAASSAPASSQNAHFGQSYQWTDGIKVTISTPQPYTPTDSAAGVVAGDKNVLFNITVMNGTSANLDVSLSQLTLNSGGTEASSITDVGSTAGFGLAPQTPVLPGQSVSWTLAFSVANPADLTGQFDLGDFEHQPAIFTN